MRVEPRNLRQSPKRGVPLLPGTRKPVQKVYGAKSVYRVTKFELERDRRKGR